MPRTEKHANETGQYDDTEAGAREQSASYKVTTTTKDFGWSDRRPKNYAETPWDNRFYTYLDSSLEHSEGVDEHEAKSSEVSFYEVNLVGDYTPERDDSTLTERRWHEEKVEVVGSATASFLDTYEDYQYRIYEEAGAPEKSHESESSRGYFSLDGADGSYSIKKEDRLIVIPDHSDDPPVYIFEGRNNYSFSAEKQGEGEEGKDSIKVFGPGVNPGGISYVPQGSGQGLVDAGVIVAGAFLDSTLGQLPGADAARSLLGGSLAAVASLLVSNPTGFVPVGSGGLRPPKFTPGVGYEEPRSPIFVLTDPSGNRYYSATLDGVPDGWEIAVTMVVGNANVAREGSSEQSSTIDKVQLALDGAGFIPVVGIAADVANAGISLYRGNYFDAGVNLIASIPGIGDAAAATVKTASFGLPFIVKLKKLNNIPWGKFCRTGCEDVAKTIQEAIGGKIVNITPKRGNTLGIRSGIETGWGQHQAVLKDGRIFDALTGPEGLSIEDYKKAWDFADDIDFGF